jgi:hypothetical protein
MTSHDHRLHYRQRLFLGTLPFCSPGTVSHATVSHDTWCKIYRGGECDCVPDVEISFPSRGTIVEVGPMGACKEVKVS